MMEPPSTGRGQRSAIVKDVRDDEEVHEMNCPRYIVFDDAPHVSTSGMSADQFAEALRSPLGVIGVRVVRQQGVASGAHPAGFQSRGCRRAHYFAKLNMVELVVNNVTQSAAS
jgi:hypothetical protein